MGNSRESARKNQAEKPGDEIIDDPLILPLEKPAFVPRSSRLDFDGIYSEQDLVHNFEMRPTFFRDAREGRLPKQVDGKLRKLMPLDLPSSKFIYLGSEVLDFLRLMSSVN